MATNTLSAFLLARGDSLAIKGGQLRLEAASGIPVTNDWLDAHREQLIAEILVRAGIDAFIFDRYSTGHYGKHKAGGITLQFSSLLTDENPYLIFNADLTRSRSTRKGKAGSPLPQGQFRIGKRSRFYQFWQSTGLAAPPRLSSFHDYMGNLKGILFTGNMVKGERLDAGSVGPINITHQQLLSAYRIAGLPDNPHTVSGQSPYNCRTRLPYKKVSQPQVQQGIQPNPITGADSYGKRFKGNGGARDDVSSLLPSIQLTDQSTDEWLADYNVPEHGNKPF